MRRSQHRAGQSGMTMVELMISIVVLLVAILSAFGTQMLSLGLITSSRETTTAGGDLQSCMERLLLLQVDEIPVPGSEFEADRVIDAYTDLNLQDERIVASYPGYVLGQEVPDPLTVALTIDWTDGKGHPRSLVLRTMKVR